MAVDPKGKKVKAGRMGDLQKVQNQAPTGPSSNHYNHLRVQLPSGKEVSLLFTDYEIERARLRALKNPEDLPKPGFFQDWLD